MEVVRLLFAVGVAWLGAAWLRALLAARPNRQPAPAWKVERLPVANGPCEVAGVWHAYRSDRISLVSALLRTEELFAARVREIDDWQALDWTTSPLEPVKGHWQWEGDKLIEEPRAAGTPAADMAAALSSAFGVPHAVCGCLACGRPHTLAQLADGICYDCRKRYEYDSDAVAVEYVIGSSRPIVLSTGLPPLPPRIHE